jgi:hypothetical protein
MDSKPKKTKFNILPVETTRDTRNNTIDNLSKNHSRSNSLHGLVSSQNNVIHQHYNHRTHILLKNHSAVDKKDFPKCQGCKMINDLDISAPIKQKIVKKDSETSQTTAPVTCDTTIGTNTDTGTTPDYDLSYTKTLPSKPNRKPTRNVFSVTSEIEPFNVLENRRKQSMQTFLFTESKKHLNNENLCTFPKHNIELLHTTRKKMGLKIFKKFSRSNL